MKRLLIILAALAPLALGGCGPLKPQQDAAGIHFKDVEAEIAQDASQRVATFCNQENVRCEF